MISLVQAAILGLIQGISELFPISSLGHSVILPRLLGWNINQNSPFFITFLVATHLATATVLFLFFWKDWQRIIAGLFRSLRQREIRKDDPDALLAWLLVVGTIPAGILGILFEEKLRGLFAQVQFAAFFLLLNGCMLFGGEILRRKKEISGQKNSEQRIAKIGWWQAIGVGSAQAIALLPGFSRTGATLTGGLLVGLSHTDSLRYSFLLATPIIGAAAVLKLPDLFTQSGQIFIVPCIIGGVTAAIGAYFSVQFLTKYFKTEKLTPFAIYCIIVGVLSSLFFLFR